MKDVPASTARGRQRIPAFPCPICKGRTQVHDSRPVDGGIRRRRICTKCRTRSTTWETLTPPHKLAEYVRAVTAALLLVEDSIRNARVAFKDFDMGEAQ